MKIFGDEIKNAALANRADYSDLFELLADVHSFCLEYINGLQLSSSEIRTVYPTALLLRSWTASQAAASLLYNGFNDEAFATVRTMLEIEFQLSAIQHEPEITERLVRDNEIYRRRRLKKLLEHKIQLPAEFQREDVEAEIQRIELEQAMNPPLTKSEVAKSGKCIKDYDTLYSYLSDVDHVSPLGLAEYVELDSSTKIATLCYGTSPFPIYYAFLWTSSIQLKSLALAAIVLKKQLRNTYLELDRRHSNLWDRHVLKRKPIEKADQESENQDFYSFVERPTPSTDR
jgi:hypothetical protein